MHIGGMRTALFNWLWARHNPGGKFILRIDDTDRQRNNDEALRPILAAFKWLDMGWDEGPEIGGPHGPYFQSQRGEIYRRAADRLLKEKKAYRDFETPAEVQQQREAADKEKRPFISSRKSLELSDTEVEKLVAERKPYVIRFLVPRGTTVALDDVVRGHVEWDASLIADPVIMRGDGTPLYNFATVVDDAAMDITHVIRAEEHLSNTPPQILMHQALGQTLPVFAHIPFVTAPGTTKKLSKREIKKYRENPKFRKMFEDADRVFPQIGLGDSETLNPVMVEYYEKIGFLPHAVFNSLARLGWSLDDRTEFMTRETIVENFTLDRIVKNPAGLDPDKLYSFQTHWIGQLTPAERLKGCKPFLRAAGLFKKKSRPTSRDLIQMINAIGERLRVFSDILNYKFFFVRDEDVPYDTSALTNSLGDAQSERLLRKLYERIARTRAWGLESIQAAFLQALSLPNGTAFEPPIAEQLRIALTSDIDDNDVTFAEAVVRDLVSDEGVKLSDIGNALRVAITGQAAGPNVFECMDVLGRRRSLNRIRLLLNRFDAKGLGSEWSRFLADFPKPIAPPYRSITTSRPRCLYRGELLLRTKSEIVEGKGSVSIRFDSSPAVRFTLRQHPGSDTSRARLFGPGIDLGEADLIVPGWDGHARAVLTNLNLGSHRERQVHGVLNGAIVLTQAVRLGSVRFFITNFHDFIGSPISDGAQTWAGRGHLEAGGWRVVVDALPDARKKSRNSAERGGFIITHCGQADRVDGADFGVEELSSFLHTLQMFFSFVRGFWVAPLLPVGFDTQGERVWRELGVRRLDSLQSVRSWFPELERDALDRAFRCFWNTWSEPAIREHLNLALYWYLEANSGTGGIETRIVSAVVALEAVGHLLKIAHHLQEPGLMSIQPGATVAEGVADLSRHVDIPEEFSGLRSFARAVGVSRGIDAIYSLRNAIVHPSPENRSLLDLTKEHGDKYWQAWYLAIWYVELGLLRAMGYSGPYVPRYRMNIWRGETEAVPWSQDAPSDLRTNVTDARRITEGPSKRPNEPNS
jgi:glutamyl-tRNA synthetase